MSTTKALIVPKKAEAVVADVPIPKLRDDYILVEVKAVALNPTDWKHIDYVCSNSERIGCDYSGTVLEVGKSVTKDLRKGDRVAGFIHGRNQLNTEDGAFGNIVTAKGDVQIKIPENISFEEASTLGVGVTTCGQGLYQSLELPLPGKAEAGEKRSILIYGGSTATGGLAIQYAKLSGLTVVTTCSPRNFDYVKSLGADAVYDYNSPSCSADIMAFTNGALAHVFDCISAKPSPEICVAAMAASGGIYSTLLPVKRDSIPDLNPAIKINSTMAYSVLNEPLSYFGQAGIPAKPEDWEFGKKFFELTRELLADGKLKVHKPAVDKFGSGFEGLVKGLDALRKREVSGEKLVFTL